MQDEREPRLLVENVSKTFGRQRVLTEMRLRIEPGELHSLVGQNGSGKSTLVKILTGVYRPDSGAVIRVDGEEIGPHVRVPDMRRVGLSVVHQTLGLIAESTAMENVRMGLFQAMPWSRRIDWQAERRQAREAFDRLGRSVDLDARVRDLTTEQAAMVAIARALQDHERGGGLIIFDESTRALREEALEGFYDVVGGVRSEGTAVLLISHRLEEVLEVSDRVTVLRDGVVTGDALPAAGLEEADLIQRMVGRGLAQYDVRRRRAAAGSKAAVRVAEVSGQALRGFSCEVAAGEILGVTGLVGSGHEELPYLLSGASRPASGRLAIYDEEIELPRLSQPIGKLAAAGVVLIPERRETQGLALELTVLENLTIPRVKMRGSAVWTGRRWQREEAETAIEELDIRPPRTDVPAGTLSGGNQQKVLLAKWLAAQPRLLLLHEPTQAVDVGARVDIVNAVRRVADGGCAVVAASSDPQELVALCDRVIVLRDGKVAAEIIDGIDEDAIVHATFGRRGEVADLKPTVG